MKRRTLLKLLTAMPFGRSLLVDLTEAKAKPILAGKPPANTAMNPLVLDAFALAIIAGGRQSIPGLPGHEPDLKAARENAKHIANAMNELRKVVPEAAAYVNESSYFEKAWQQSFWGAQNYDKLKAIKAKYDPDELFFVHQGVASETWSSDGFKKK